LTTPTLAIDETFPSFLAKTYKYKEISDYSVGRMRFITMDEARDKIEKAVRFTQLVKALLTAQ
jgi:hypothetical protein